mmetsp:Transcript_41534/g.103243  ORF Transcript_41534/g.103243 Transcript_41534/m.103243 type:complete len:244 (+) Transcript_41534:169-900(+)
MLAELAVLAKLAVLPQSDTFPHVIEVKILDYVVHSLKQRLEDLHPRAQVSHRVLVVGGEHRFDVLPLWERTGSEHEGRPRDPPIEGRERLLIRCDHFGLRWRLLGRCRGPHVAAVHVPPEEANPEHKDAPRPEESHRRARVHQHAARLVHVAPTLRFKQVAHRAVLVGVELIVLLDLVHVGVRLAHRDERERPHPHQHLVRVPPAGIHELADVDIGLVQHALLEHLRRGLQHAVGELRLARCP